MKRVGLGIIIGGLAAVIPTSICWLIYENFGAVWLIAYLAFGSAIAAAAAVIFSIVKDKEYYEEERPNPDYVPPGCRDSETEYWDRLDAKRNESLAGLLYHRQVYATKGIYRDKNGKALFSWLGFWDVNESRWYFVTLENFSDEVDLSVYENEVARSYLRAGVRAIWVSKMGYATKITKEGWGIRNEKTMPFWMRKWVDDVYGEAAGQIMKEKIRKHDELRDKIYQYDRVKTEGWNRSGWK